MKISISAKMVNRCWTREYYIEKTNENLEMGWWCEGWDLGMVEYLTLTTEEFILWWH